MSITASSCSVSWYPVFIRHEEIGLTALYINRLLTRRIFDCSDGDSRELLSRL